jgi:2,3-diaminopropionate biosynthesis protein SbnA
MIREHLTDFYTDDIFLRLVGFTPGVEVLLKIEGFNAAGSSKLKSALGMIHALEAKGVLRPGVATIDSSSGNLAWALAAACRERGYNFECVCDPNTLPRTLQIIRAYGAKISIVTKRDQNDGYLQSRIDFIKERCAGDPGLVWFNQYANTAIRDAHDRWTGAAILREVPEVFAIFAGVGTSGTLMGINQHLMRHAPTVRLFGVDAEGSVTFGHPPAKRLIPGIGASGRPELFDDSAPIDRVVVSEMDTVAMAREMLSTRGLLLGGSTASVLAAVRRSAGQIPQGATVVAVSADLGAPYLDTIYDDAWIAKNFPSVRGLACGSDVACPA